MTLAEVAVSLALASVVMALVTAAVVQMYHISGRVDVLSTNMTQLQTAFQQMDRSVRYATAISQPNTTPTPDGGWYVEWSSARDGIAQCSQMRLHEPSGVLQRRSRPAGGQVSAWATVASFVIGTRPFTLEPASGSGYPHHRLTVDVTVRSAAGGAERRSTFSFTALNTTLATATTGVCTDLGRT